MSLSKIFLFSCLAFIIGVFLGLITQNAQLILLGVLFLISFISSLAFKKLRWLIVFCLIFFIFGFLRADFSQAKIADNELQNFNGQEIVLDGIVVKEPEITQKNQKLVIEVQKISGGRSSVSSPFIGSGKVLVYTSFYPKYQYGDELQIKGMLEKPPMINDFDYKQYLAQKGIYSIMFSPEIISYSAIASNGNDKNIDGSSSVSWIYKKILGFKSKLRVDLEQNFLSTHKLLLGAMILGDKARLTTKLKDTLNQAGIRHLTAISGMHVTILVNILMLMFLGLGLWRKQAFWLTTIFILFFVIMTGCQTSTIRASIMGFLFLLGQNFGRTGDSSRAIVFGATLMLAFNPLFLIEVGFQLSFLAVIGINYLTPIFSRWLRKIPNPIQVRNILAMSLAAQVFTLPLLIYHFGYFSLVAPITNILVLPLLPFIIIFGFLSAFVRIFSHFLSLIFVFPCWLLLSYLLKVADIFSSFSFSLIHLRNSWIWFIIFYCALGFLIWHWKKEHRFKILGF